MKLYLIRHGQTDWNVEGRIQGSYDSELNETGIRQAEELAAKVRESGCKFSKVYCSTQKRALMTAEILSRASGADCIPAKGLEEMNLGDWEGLKWAEVQEKYPEEYGEWFNNRRYTRTPNGESYQDLLDRVLKVLEKIIGENSEDVAIVTHGAVIMSLRCYITGTPFSEMWNFHTKNTDIIEIDEGDLYAKNT